MPDQLDPSAIPDAADVACRHDSAGTMPYSSTRTAPGRGLVPVLPVPPSQYSSRERRRSRGPVFRLHQVWCGHLIRPPGLPVRAARVAVRPASRSASSITGISDVLVVVIVTVAAGADAGPFSQVVELPLAARRSAG